MCGEPVRVNSPGCSAINESIVLSAKFSAVNGDSRPVFAVPEPPFVEPAVELLEPEIPFCSAGAVVVVVDVTSDEMCIFIPQNFFLRKKIEKNVAQKTFTQFTIIKILKLKEIPIKVAEIEINFLAHPSARDRFKNVSVTAKTFPRLTHFDR